MCTSYLLVLAWLSPLHLTSFAADETPQKERGKSWKERDLTLLLYTDGAELG